MILITVFLYGFLAAAAALLLEGLGLAVASPLVLSLILIAPVAFIEEGAKWIFFRQFHARFCDRINLPSPLFLGISFGLGFFSVELGLIAFGMKSLSLFPLIGILLVHLLTSLFFAYYLFRLAPRSLFHTWALLFGMVILHAAYNIFAYF